MSLHKHFPINHCGRDFVVSDIHGCFDKLEEKLTEIQFNPKTDRLFCAGDMVDRGSYSEKCLDWLSKPWFHSVRGNHEQMIINAYRGSERDLALSIQNGGEWFNCLFKQDKLEYVEAFELLPYAISIDTKYGKI
jgi:serine/threonine protein phosphatase 1